MDFNPHDFNQNVINVSRNKCSYRNEIETRKKPKSKEKIELKFANYQKQKKGRLLAENADI